MILSVILFAIYLYFEMWGSQVTCQLSSKEWFDNLFVVRFGSRTGGPSSGGTSGVFSSPASPPLTPASRTRWNNLSSQKIYRVSTTTTATTTNNKYYYDYSTEATATANSFE